MKSASPNVVPNVFVKQACLGNAWAAKGAWVKRRPELNGFSPYEIWDHPELLLSEQERAENPSAGLLTLVTVRGKVIRHIAFLHSHASTLPVSTVGNLPYYDATPTISIPTLHRVRDEDPAAVPDALPTPVSLSGPGFRIPGTFDRLPVGRIGATVGPTNGTKPVKAFRHGNRRARRHGRAFRGR